VEREERKRGKIRKEMQRVKEIVIYQMK